MGSFVQPVHHRIASEVITAGDTSTPTVIELTVFEIIETDENAVTDPVVLNVRICNDGTFAESTNATIAPTSGFAETVETISATKDLILRTLADAAATGTLTISGDVINGETVTINGRVYEFSTDGDIDGGSDVEVDVSGDGTKSQGTLTMDTQPTATDTVTIGARVYTWTADGTADADGEVDVGADLAEAKTNFEGAIAGTHAGNTAHPTVTAAAFSGDDMVITAIAPGVAGDSIPTTETFTEGTNVFDAATLGTTTAGVDVTATEAGDALVTALAGDSSAVVTGVNTTGTVVLTATVTGTAPNAYTTTEAMANGSFGAGTLSGGADATEGGLRVSVTDGSAETVTLRYGIPPVGGVAADCSEIIQITHAAP